MTRAKLERLRALLDAWEADALRGDEEGELRGLVREAAAVLARPFVAAIGLRSVDRFEPH